MAQTHHMQYISEVNKKNEKKQTLTKRNEKQ